MFIPIVIPTSIKTHKKWIVDIQNTPFLGGYIIMLIAMFPPFLLSVLMVSMFEQIINKSFPYFWALVLFLFGIFLLLWDKWLRGMYDTEIKLFYIMLEYIAYVAIIIALIMIYI